MEAVATDGARIRYEVTGKGSTVLLLHGLADDHTLWRHQVPALAARFRVVSVDLRGHGRSSGRPLPASMETYTDDVVAVLDAMGAERATVVGLSMGGGVAQVLALRAPERVRALGLISTSSAFPDETRRRFVERADLAEREGMAAVVEATVPRWFAPRFREEHPEVLDATRAIVLANDPAAFAAASRINATRDWTERLGEIRCATLFVAGLEDPADVRDTARVYAERMETVEVHLIENASHLVPVEQPGRFNRLLVDFLERTSAR